MKYILTVSGPPYGTQNANSALLFAHSVILKKHTLRSIFFYSSGVYHSNSMIFPSKDELNFLKKWSNLFLIYQVNLYVCVNSAYQRGILPKKIALKLGFLEGNFSKFFKLVGLSVLSFEIQKCDRFLQF
ncbi:sulfurtransferase complex subunit TusD [Buchnera aphidicola]|uniref:sulfurtransferase complex subunit TusD n=1 Tax=Buchnera aphidicola TaxID=9 RepID=UPI0031B6ED8D